MTPPRLLLRDAVHGAETEDEIAGVDAHHLARRKEAGENPQGHPIGGIVERRHEHHVVADVEVQVARGEGARRRSRAAGASGSSRRAADARSGRASPAGAPGCRREVRGSRRSHRARRRRRRCRRSRNAPRRRRGRAYRRPRCRRRATARARLPAPAAGCARFPLGTGPGCAPARAPAGIARSSAAGPARSRRCCLLRGLRAAVRRSWPRRSRTGACRGARRWSAGAHRRAARRDSAPSR